MKTILNGFSGSISCNYIVFLHVIFTSLIKHRNVCLLAFKLPILSFVFWKQIFKPKNTAEFSCPMAECFRRLKQSMHAKI